MHLGSLLLPSNLSADYIVVVEYSKAVSLQADTQLLSLTSSLFFGIMFVLVDSDFGPVTYCMYVVVNRCIYNELADITSLIGFE